MANIISPQHASSQRQAIYERLDRTLEFAEAELRAQIPVDRANTWDISATQVNLTEDGEALDFFPGYPSDSTLNVTRELAAYVSHFIEAFREGLGPDGVGSVIRFSPLWDVVNPTTHVRQFYLYEDDFGPRNMHWQQEGRLETDKGPPHIILFIANGMVARNDTLTTGELMMRLQALMIRYEEPAFVGHDTLPLLIMSYVGPKHGRILQAHHDGERLVIQFSPIMSFVSEDVASATAEFFTRYAASTPEGTTGLLHAEIAIRESFTRPRIH
ncbi:hypothetical protein BJX70DRAFT_395169 [Aspergillus crustosus]